MCVRVYIEIFDDMIRAGIEILGNNLIFVLTEDDFVAKPSVPSFVE